MRYVSEITRRGNSSYSYESQEAAEANALFLDENGCSDCTGCTDCTRCTDCTDCTGCTRCTVCTGCTGCTDCTYCTGCTRCTDCTRCTRCTDCTRCTYCTRCTRCTYCTYCTRCTDCTDCTGVLHWDGPPATQLLSLNGLLWPVATDGAYMQIGCRQHSLTQWGKFTDEQIDAMSEGAFAFWGAHKSLIMALADARAAILNATSTGGISC